VRCVAFRELSQSLNHRLIAFNLNPSHQIHQHRPQSQAMPTAGYAYAKIFQKSHPMPVVQKAELGVISSDHR